MNWAARAALSVSTSPRIRSRVSCSTTVNPPGAEPLAMTWTLWRGIVRSSDRHPDALLPYLSSSVENRALGRRPC
jgi:hypothetical protein